MTARRRLCRQLPEPLLVTNCQTFPASQRKRVVFEAFERDVLEPQAEEHPDSAAVLGSLAGWNSSKARSDFSRFCFVLEGWPCQHLSGSHDGCLEGRGEGVGLTPCYATAWHAMLPQETSAYKFHTSPACLISPPQAPVRVGLSLFGTAIDIVSSVIQDAAASTAWLFEHRPSV